MEIEENMDTFMKEISMQKMDDPKENMLGRTRAILSMVDIKDKETVPFKSLNFYHLI